ncbi:MAG TPA: aldo/keto reductase [Vicinamibacterales bacterium]
MFQPRTLGRTSLSVGALGISASYGVPATAVERAIDAGMTYVYWGSRRRGAFAEALRRAASRSHPHVLVIQSYAPFGWAIERSLEGALRTLGRDHADVLLLGMWNRQPPQRVLDACQRLRARGLVRFIAASTHARPVVPALTNGTGIDIVHVRYNAVHRGAERDVFPSLPADHRPGIVSFTATSWRQLLDPRRVPRGERVPTAADCYRFVLTNPVVDVCMTGPATGAHVEDAVRASELGPMDESELAWMRRVGDAIYNK